MAMPLKTLVLFDRPEGCPEISGSHRAAIFFHTVFAFSHVLSCVHLLLCSCPTKCHYHLRGSFFSFAALQRPVSQHSAGSAASGVPGSRLVPRAGQLPGGDLHRLRAGDTHCLLQVGTR